MACRGVHFAVSPEQADALQSADGDDALMALIEGIEETWERDNLAESDKAWDAMHRCLTDGQLDFGNGPFPLNHCVLGPRQLHKGGRYIVSLVLPDEVKAVAAALESITSELFHERYMTLVPKDYALEYGDDDLEYTWSYFEEVRDLFKKAAERQRAVIFTVDQ